MKVFVAAVFVFAVASALENGEMGACVEECSMNDDCPTGQTCQSNGCGHTCQSAALASTDAECPGVFCLLYCEHGWEQDENGCDVCGCASPPPSTSIEPTATCPGVHCFMFCLDGWAKDENGCEICQCELLPPVVTTAASVMANGEFGACIEECSLTDDSVRKCPYFQTCQSNGCGHTCQPGALEAASVLENDKVGICVEECSMNDDCPTGQTCQSNGCGHTCQSAALDTSDQKCLGAYCLLYCQHGWEKDENGCDTCSCALQPSPTPKCSYIMCAMHCEKGFQTGPDGCLICKCKDSDTLIG